MADAIGGSDCETIRDGLLSQPTNALTSACYIAAGLVVWMRIPADQRKGPGGAYAVLLALVGVGSVLYHGPQPVGSKFLHDAPIPALLVLIGGLVLIRVRRGQAPFPGMTRARLAYVLALGAAGGAAYVLGRTDSPVCDPGSPFQFHGVWHIATAVAFVVVADMLFRPGTEHQPWD